MTEHTKDCIEYNEKYESDIPPNFRECICEETPICWYCGQEGNPDKKLNLCKYCELADINQQRKNKNENK